MATHTPVPPAGTGRKSAPQAAKNTVPGAVWQVRVRTKLDDLHQQLRELETRDPANTARIDELRAQLSRVEPALGRSPVTKS